MPINASTKVEITLKLLVTGIAALVVSLTSLMAAGLGVLGWILSFTIGDLKESNAKLQTDDREMIKHVNDINVEMINRTNETNAKFTEQVNKFTLQLSDTTKTMNDLSGRMTDLQIQIKNNQSAWSDPKFLSYIADSLKKDGVTGNIVIIPPK